METNNNHMEESTKQMIDEAVSEYKEHVEECKNELCCQKLPELKDAFEVFCEITLATFTGFMQNMWQSTHPAPKEYSTRLVEYDKDTKLYRLDYLCSLLPCKMRNVEVSNNLTNTWTDILTWLNGKKSENTSTVKRLWDFFRSIDQMLQCVNLYRGHLESRKCAINKLCRYINELKRLKEDCENFAHEELFPPIKPDILNEGMDEINYHLRLALEKMNKLKEAFDDPLLEVGYYDNNDHKNYFCDAVSELINEISRDKRNPDTIIWKHIAGYFRSEFGVMPKHVSQWGASLYNAHFFGSLGNYFLKIEHRYLPDPLSPQKFHEMTKCQKNQRMERKKVAGVYLFYHVNEEAN